MATAAEVALLCEMVVDRATQTVYIDGVPHGKALSKTEFRLLAALAREPDRVWTKQELMRDVWDWAHAANGQTRTLDSHVAKLRAKLPPGYVHNVHGRGYHLVPAGEAAKVRLTDSLGSTCDLHERAEALGRQARELAARAHELAATLDGERAYAIEAIAAYGIAERLRDAAQMALFVADRVV